MSTSWFLFCNTLKQLSKGNLKEASDAWMWFTFHTGKLLKGEASEIK